VKAAPRRFQFHRGAKSEDRNPKAERRPKSEGRIHQFPGGYENGLSQGAVACQFGLPRGQRARIALWPLRISDLGLLSVFGLRVSSFPRHALAHQTCRATLQIWLTILLLGLAAGLLAQQPALEEGRSRFRAVDIYVDAGSTPLAAYQLEFAATNGVARIVGIEGGEHPAFRQPPFYDPKAIQSERVLIASFSTASATDLPSGKTRVATIHCQTTDTQPPRFELKLQTAGDAQGNKISAQASFMERKMP
jgi:hypothetical protein